METNPLVSIIMAAYNVSAFVGEAIKSVLGQTYSNWELLIINDGSYDNTEDVILSFSDPRIIYYAQTNQGVSAARNQGLKYMRGDFFCFLDADDILTRDSIALRLGKFLQNPAIQFIDGRVQAMDLELNFVQRDFIPRFRGNPLEELKMLKENCFYGITWMIRREPGRVYSFNKHVKYAEDLLFYLELSNGGLYDFINDIIYINRQVPGSAMHNISGLINGYRFLLPYLLKHFRYSFKQKLHLYWKIQLLLIKLFVRYKLNKGKIPSFKF